MNTFLSSTQTQQQQQQQQQQQSNGQPQTNSLLNNKGPLILKAPQAKDIIFFNENGFINTANQLLSYFTSNSSTVSSSSSTSVATNASSDTTSTTTATTTNIASSSIHLNSSLLSPVKKLNRVKKKVKFPEDGRIIHGYSNPPKLGWTPGMYSTSDLLDAYTKSCDRHKSRPLAKLIPQLKALQDLDCANGEKVNVLNLKSRKYSFYTGKGRWGVNFDPRVFMHITIDLWELFYQF